MTPGITFTCTGQGSRGTHDSAIPLEQTEGTGARAKAARWLACPVCQRQVRLGARVLQKLSDAGLTKLDISQMPF